MKLIEINKAIRKLKISYENSTEQEFLEGQAKNNPFEQFVDWFSEALQKELRPSVMVLATVDENGLPDTRTVAIQELQMNQLIFYSSYESPKAQHILHQNIIAANFYWPISGRQIRIKANIEKLEKQKNENYFLKRKREVQLSIHAWVPSTLITSREDLENKMKTVSAEFKDKPIFCPDCWGGYVITPFEYEFYQRRSNLLNDRFLYKIQDKKWHRVRLTP